MSNQRFDVIIPVGGKDVSFVHRVVDHIFRCFRNVDKVYILSSLSLAPKLSKSLAKYSDNCSILDENDLLTGLTFSTIGNLLRERSEELCVKTGWYFQQFLKLAFARSKYSNDYYLSWDADTLPLAEIDFFNGNNILYTPKVEYHRAYFNTINRLLGFGKVVDNSFISEHMLFSTKIVNEMLSDIENSIVPGKTWYEKILSACNFKESDLAFSEFETYGSYCYEKYPGLYIPRHLNTFREAGLICGRYISEKKLRLLSFDVDIASFEMFDAPMFPYNIPNIVYNMKGICQKIIKMPLKEILRKLYLRFNVIKTDTEDAPQEMLFRLPPPKK